jgi:IQ calmodulin-binding motif
MEASHTSCQGLLELPQRRQPCIVINSEDVAYGTVLSPLVIVFQASPLGCELPDGTTHRIRRLDQKLEQQVLSRIFEKHSSNNNNGGIDFRIGTLDGIAEFLHTRQLQPRQLGHCEVLHLSCHGHDKYLALEDAWGGLECLNVNSLHEWLSRSTVPEFVFVAACESRSIGETFVKAGAMHVVCAVHDYSEITSAFCIEFSKVMYRSMLSGSSVHEAFDLARSQTAAIEIFRTQRFCLLPEVGNHHVRVFRSRNLPILQAPQAPTFAADDQKTASSNSAYQTGTGAGVAAIRYNGTPCNIQVSLKPKHVTSPSCTPEPGSVSPLSSPGNPTLGVDHKAASTYGTYSTGFGAGVAAIRYNGKPYYASAGLKATHTNFPSFTSKPDDISPLCSLGKLSPSQRCHLSSVSEVSSDTACLERTHRHPNPPDFFVRSDVEMYRIVRAVSVARIVFVTGEEGCGKTTLVQASCSYLQDRMAINELKGIFWIETSNSAHQMKTNWRSLLRITPSRQVLVVVDAKKVSEKTGQELAQLLKLIVQESPLGKFIVIHRTDDSVKLQMGTFPCIEHNVAVDRLNLEDTVRLFGKFCQHVFDHQSKGIFSEDSLWQHIAPPSTMDRNIYRHRARQYTGICGPEGHCYTAASSSQASELPNRHKVIFKLLGEGFPREIIHVAKKISVDDYSKVVFLGGCKELDGRDYQYHNGLLLKQLDVCLSLVSSIRKKSYVRSTRLQIKLVCISMMRKEIRSVRNLKDDLDGIDGKFTEAWNNNDIGEVHSLFNRRENVLKRLQGEVAAILGSPKHVFDISNPEVLDTCCNKQIMMENVLLKVQDLLADTFKHSYHYLDDDRPKGFVRKIITVDDRLMRAEGLLEQAIAGKLLPGGIPKQVGMPSTPNSLSNDSFTPNPGQRFPTSESPYCSGKVNDQALTQDESVSRVKAVTHLQAMIRCHLAKHKLRTIQEEKHNEDLLDMSTTSIVIKRGRTTPIRSTKENQQNHLTTFFGQAISRRGKDCNVRLKAATHLQALIRRHLAKNKLRRIQEEQHGKELPDIRTPSIAVKGGRSSPVRSTKENHQSHLTTFFGPAISRSGKDCNNTSESTDRLSFTKRERTRRILLQRRESISGTVGERESRNLIRLRHSNKERETAGHEKRLSFPSVSSASEAASSIAPSALTPSIPTQEWFRNKEMGPSQARWKSPLGSPTRSSQSLSSSFTAAASTSSTTSVALIASKQKQSRFLVEASSTPLAEFKSSLHSPTLSRHPLSCPPTPSTAPCSLASSSAHTSSGPTPTWCQEDEAVSGHWKSPLRSPTPSEQFLSGPPFHRQHSRRRRRSSSTGGTSQHHPSSIVLPSTYHSSSSLDISFRSSAGASVGRSFGRRRPTASFIVDNRSSVGSTESSFWSPDGDQDDVGSSVVSENSPRGRGVDAGSDGGGSTSDPPWPVPFVWLKLHDRESNAYGADNNDSWMEADDGETAHLVTRTDD